MMREERSKNFTCSHFFSIAFPSSVMRGWTAHPRSSDLHRVRVHDQKGLLDLRGEDAEVAFGSSNVHDVEIVDVRRIISKKSERMGLGLGQIAKQDHAREQASNDTKLSTISSERAAMQRRHDEQNFNRLIGSVMEGCSFVQELDRSIGVLESAEYGKKMKQYLEWNGQVFCKIQQRVGTRVDNLSEKHLNAQKRLDFEVSGLP
jgi:hypothetical protein